MPRTKPADVVPLFRPAADDAIEEVAVGRQIIRPPEPATTAAIQAIDLSDRVKVLMAIGPGNSGKTTFLRWLAEIILNRGGETILAAVDPENRELRDYFEAVHEPPSYDPARVAKWIEDLLAHCMDKRVSACIDFGGGDTTLGRLIAEAPDLVSVLEEAGVSPVAFYFLTPRIADLSPLASLEAAGFQPRATALVLNEGRTDPTLTREEAFARIMRHSAFRAAVERGAIPIWMPRLFAAKEVEDRRIRFAQARDAEIPEGRRMTPLNSLDRSRVRAWMDSMAATFAPKGSNLGTWLP
jgi:energy-coupling factor transporter ATP-binding protein EcfA2